MTQIKVKGIGKYIANKEIRRMTLFRINSEGKSFYIYKGESITKDSFYKMFPVSLQKVNYKGENPDKTKVK